jgi:hypothetical protein
VKVRCVMRLACLHEHADDDSEEPTEFRHDGIILRPSQRSTYERRRPGYLASVSDGSGDNSRETPTEFDQPSPKVHHSMVWSEGESTVGRVLIGIHSDRQ